MCTVRFCLIAIFFAMQTLFKTYGCRVSSSFDSSLKLVFCSFITLQLFFSLQCLIKFWNIFVSCQGSGVILTANFYSFRFVWKWLTGNLLIHYIFQFHWFNFDLKMKINLAERFLELDQKNILSSYFYLDVEFHF